MYDTTRTDELMLLADKYLDVGARTALPILKAAYEADWTDIYVEFIYFKQDYDDCVNALLS